MQLVQKTNLHIPLFFISFSLFYIYWLEYIIDELKQSGFSIPNKNFISVIFLGIISGILINIFLIKTNIDNLSSYLLIFILILLLSHLYILYKICLAISQGTQNKINSNIALLLLFFLPPIGTMYLQKQLNTISSVEMVVDQKIQVEDSNSKAINYIVQYKSLYPKESIYQGLINSGVEASKAQKLINKYY